MKMVGQNGNGVRKALPTLAAAFLPVFALAADRLNDQYRLRDEVNEGGEVFETGGGHLLSGSIGTMDSIPLTLPGEYMVSPGPQNIFYFPGTVTDLALSSESDSTLNLSWSAPGAGVNYNQKVSSYKVWYSSLTQLNQSNFNEGSSFTPSVDSKEPGYKYKDIPLNGLTYDSLYYVGIVSIDNENPSNVSFPGFAQPVRTKPHSPIPNGSLSADPNDLTVSVDFSPNNPSLGHLLKFVGIITKDSSPSSPFIQEIDINSVSDNNTRTIVFSGTHDHPLKAKEKYHVFLKCYGNNGDGPDTGWIDAGDIEIDNGIPALGEPTNLTASGFTVNWSNIKSKVKYQAQIDTKETFPFPFPLPSDPTTNITSQPFSALKGNTTYYFRLVAYDKNDNLQGYTSSAHAVTNVKKPVGITAKDVNTTAATVVLSEDTDNDIGPHQYRVALATSSTFLGDVQFKTVSYAGGATTPAEFDTLLPNRPYYVRVIGINRNGVESEGVDTYRSDNPIFYTLPAPIDVTVGTSQDPLSQVSISWTSGDNHEKLTSYVAKLYASLDCNEPLVQSATINPGNPLNTVFSNSTSFPILANKGYSACVTVKDADTNRKSDVVSSPVTPFTSPLAAQSIQTLSSSDTLKVSWSDAKDSVKNSDATVYRLEWKEDGASTSLGSASVPGTGPLELSAIGLKANTIYQLSLQVSTPTGSNWNNESSTWKSVTLATVPVVAAEGFHLFTTSGTVTWGANGNPDGTKYEPQLATDDQFSQTIHPESQGVLSATFTLTANTTYWARVRAANRADPPTPTDWVMWASQATDVKSPTGVTLGFGTEDHAKNLIVSWTKNDNPPGTRYSVLLIKKGGDFGNPLYTGEQTQNPAGDNLLVPFGELKPNTIYQARVLALGHNGHILYADSAELKTDLTPVTGSITLVPTPGNEKKQVTLSWDNTLNSADTLYEVELSMNNQFPADATTNRTTEANASTYTFDPSLQSNRQYFARVRGKGGTTFSDTATAITFPSIPTGFTPTHSGVDDAARQVAFNWSPGDNEPLGTSYEVKLLNGNSQEIDRRTVSGTTFVFNVSTANAFYSARIAAIAKDGNTDHNTSFNEVQASTYTAPLSPQVAALDVNVDSITVHWNTFDGAVYNALETEYRLSWRPGDGAAGPIKGAGALSLPAAGLTPNTPYSLVLTAKADPSSGFQDKTWTENRLTTKARDPNPIGFEIFTTSAAVQWNTRDNPVGTVYRVDVGENPTIQSGDHYSETTDRRTDVTGLAPNTTYYAKIRAKNQTDNLTDPVAVWSARATNALPASVSDGDFAVYTDSCSVKWAAGNNPIGTVYKVMVTDNGDFSAPTQSLTVVQNTMNQIFNPPDFTGLTPNKGLLMRVDTLGRNGAAVPSPVLQGQTAAAPIVQVTVAPYQDPRRMMKVDWNTNGNSVETKYVVELSSDSAFGPGATLSATTGAGASSAVFDQGLFPNHLYYARVKADVSGSAFAAIASGSTWPTEPVNVSASAVDPSAATHRVAFSWGSGDNDPARTAYAVQLSTFVGTHEYVLKTLTTATGAQRMEFSEEDGIVWANQKYFGTVAAVPIDGQSEHASSRVSAESFTAPLAVQPGPDFKVEAQSTGTISIAWAAPSAETNGKTIRNAAGTSFQVNWALKSSRFNSPLIDGAGTDFHYMLGSNGPLTANATYYIDVVAVPQIGSPFNPARCVLVPAPGTLANPAVFDGSMVSVFQTSMTVVWGPHGNAEGTIFRLAVYDQSKSVFLEPITTTSTRVTTPAYLTPASSYQIGVDVLSVVGAPLVGNSTARVTKPVSPAIDFVRKPDAVGREQQIELGWTSGGNGQNVLYFPYQDGTKMSNSAVPSPYVFVSPNPNSKVQLTVRAYNGEDPSFHRDLSTETWTRAEPPAAASIISPLVANSMGIAFPETSNPPMTEYAIQIVAASEEVDPPPHGFADLTNPDVPGEAQFNVDVPIWRTPAAWLSEGKLFLSNLPDVIGYRIVLLSRNHSGQEEVSPTGLDIKQSAGVPEVTLTTPQGIVETNTTSRSHPVYYNSTEVPFRAAHSSHYNVLFGPSETMINGGNVSNTHGWNGFINPAGDCVDAQTPVNSAGNAALRGFCSGGEGTFYLNIAGTALLTTGVDRSNISSTTSFRVIIDTTPPVPAEIQLSFVAEPFEPLPQDTLFGNPTPYFVWSSTDTLGNGASRSPLVGWSYSVSTDPAVVPLKSVESAPVPIGSTDPVRGFIPYRENPGITVDLHGVTTSSATVYYRVRGYDKAGNWTADPVPTFQYRYTPDQKAPFINLEAIGMDGKKFPSIDRTFRYAAVTPSTGFLHLTFSEPMLMPKGSVQLTLLRGPDGGVVNRPVPLISIDTSLSTQGDGTQILPFSSPVALEPGCLYHFFTSTRPAPTDRANNPLESSLDMLFYTAMDPAAPAVFASENDPVRVAVSPYALGKEWAGVAVNDRPDKISVSGSPSLPRVLGEATDALGRQNGGSFKKILLAKELTVFNTKGEMRAQPFAGDVRLVFDYAPLIPLSPAQTVKPTDLVIYELDERTGVWAKMPDGRVDETTHSAWVPLRHNGTYALGTSPNYDLSGAHPYPVPYRAARDAHGITFTGLSSYGTIKVYSLDGRLVKTLHFDGDSAVAWDPVQNDSGEAVGSDVYLYTIENDKQRVVGKLMVIR